MVEASKGDRRVERDDDRHCHRLQEDQQGLDKVELPRLVGLPQRVGRDKAASSASGVGSPRAGLSSIILHIALGLPPFNADFVDWINFANIFCSTRKF